MAIELPDEFARILNLLGLARPLGWTNFNEDAARDVGALHVSHGKALQEATGDAATHVQRAVASGSGPATDAMSTVANDPKGAVNNLADHATGHKAFGTLVGYSGDVVEGGKVFQLGDLAITGVQLAAATATALVGGGFAIPAALAEGKIAQTAIMNGMNQVFSGGSST